MRITGKEIAKLAGVSESTVSKVLNGYKNIPQETKDKIYKIIRENNYVPNRSAQLLTGRRSNIFGIFVVELGNMGWGKSQLVTRSPYYSSIISYAIDAAKKHGYLFLVYEVSEKEDLEYIRELFMNGTISGGMIIGAEKQVDEIDQLVKEGNNIVFINSKRPDWNNGKNSVYINVNNEAGIRKSIYHLIDKGHGKIAHLAGDLSKRSAIERKNEFIKVMKEEGLEIGENQIKEAGFVKETGYEAAMKLLEDYSPTAIVCANDSVAIATIQAIQAKGLNVPADISVVGFDNIKAYENFTPRLTTIDYSLEDMTNIAVDYLVENVKEEKSKSEDYVLPVKLIKRDSVGEVKV